MASINQQYTSDKKKYKFEGLPAPSTCDQIILPNGEGAGIGDEFYLSDSEYQTLKTLLVLTEVKTEGSKTVAKDKGSPSSPADRAKTDEGGF